MTALNQGAASPADEIRLPTGETVAIPAALREAIQDACPVPIPDDPALEAGRAAFAHRFPAALFARGLLLVERGKPAGRETVGVDAYSLVCSQKHALEARLARIAALVTGELGLSHGDLVTNLDELLAILTGRAPSAHPGDDLDRARARIGHKAVDLKNRLTAIHRLALDLPDYAAAPADATPSDGESA